MLLDRTELLKIKEQFTLETSLLGKLRIGPLSYNGLQKLENKYDYLKGATPIDVIRYFITTVAYPYKPEKKEISSDDKKISIKDSEKLSEAELNEFSKKFIEYNEDYLLEKFKISENEILLSKESMCREENETSIKYLSRLIIIKINDYIRENEAIAKNLGIINLSNLFPNHLAMDILNTSGSNNKLYESMLSFQKEINNIQKYSNLIQGLEHPVQKLSVQKTIDFQNIKIERPTDRIRETNKKLDVLIEYQSKMGPVVEDSSNLLGDMNKLWIGMAADSKKDSKKIIRLNWIIIIITAISFMFAIFFSYLNYKSSIENSRITEKYMSLLIKENRKLNYNIHEYQKSLYNFLNNQSDNKSK